MPQSPADTYRDAASHAARSEHTINTAQPGQSDEANVNISISTRWYIIATFDSESEYNDFKESHAQGFRSGKDRKWEVGCVLVASLDRWTCTDLDCFAICRYKEYKCKRCCDPSDATVDYAGKRSYSAVQPKCGFHYRSGIWAKSGTKPKGPRGRSLSGTSGTGKQNKYEPRGAKIMLYRRRAEGTTGCHALINPEFVMFGVLPSHPTDSC